MMKSVNVTVQIGEHSMMLETGMLAAQAHGAVTVRLGDTILFAAVTASDKPREGIDYFPLQVEYREKFYAAGRFPGGFFKREARPSEKEILTARCTDRPIRPLFPDDYHNEVQINNMLLSADGENDSDMLSIVGASAALMLSEIPFSGPIAAVRIGRVDGRFIVNPSNAQREAGDLELVYAANRDYPIMIEGGGNEVSETDMVAAMRHAHLECVKLIDAQIELRRLSGKAPKTVPATTALPELLDTVRKLAGADLRAAVTVPGKADRKERMNAVRTALTEKLLETTPETTAEAIRAAWDALEIETIRKAVLDDGRRVDGRAPDELRPLEALVGVLPRTHGSAIFCRGETQVLASATLGTDKDSQSMDAVTGGPSDKRFFLHYNFPPYCVGETGRLGSTSRREIGHGALAERSLEPMLPADYPYSVRLVNEVMSCNGSSSMATICSGCLALMDAGVPIKRPVAGISIGLFSDADRAVLVTDIIGAEDHCGDMDFKVAGTRNGITGFQVDLKIRGLRWDLVEGAFEKARLARIKILDYMATVLDQPRAELSPYAPRIQQIKIDPEKIGLLIGPGGKNIRRIVALSGAQIDVEDDGTVSIFSSSKDALEIAVREVEMISAEVEEGLIYDGVVSSVKEFGAFVEVLPGKDGLVHISELADFRVNRVEDICKVGDQMLVKCIGIDERGRVRLSRRAAMQENDAAPDA